MTIRLLTVSTEEEDEFGENWQRGGGACGCGSEVRVVATSIIFSWAW